MKTRVWTLMMVVCGLTLRAWGQYAVEWWTLDAGGGTSAGGSYTLSGTIGQPDTGVMAGGSFTLSGGFWPGVVVPSTGETPTLFIQSAAGELIITWMPVTPGFALESTEDLARPSWSAVGSSSPVKVVPAGRAAFYRLRKP